jgi:hypothetical protein
MNKKTKTAPVAQPAAEKKSNSKIGLLLIPILLILCVVCCCGGLIIGSTYKKDSAQTSENKQTPTISTTPAPTNLQPTPQKSNDNGSTDLIAAFFGWLYKIFIQPFVDAFINSFR